MLREAALVLFLVAVALGLWLADVRPLGVVAVMALALAVAWVIEWVSWRDDQLQSRRPVPEEARMDDPTDPPPAPAPRARGFWLLRLKRGEQSSEDKEEEVTEEQPPPDSTEAVEADEAPAAASKAEPAPPKAEPVPAKAEAAPAKAAPADARPSRRRLRPVRSATPPPPPPEPEPSLPPPEPEPEGAPVVPLWARSSQPREWNLWELERIARAQSRRDPERFEEWSYLFLHLRRFANADGMLPAEFDGLVRDSFGGLLEPAQGA
jgi:hypothetical protein